MKLSDYIYEVKGVLLACFSGGLFFTLVLAAFGVSAAQLVLLWVCFCLILFSTLICCWQKKRRRLSYLRDTFEALEPKYLMAEIADGPDSALEQVYFHMLQRALKSMADQVASSQRQTKEYQEFLEQWVHEIKLPVTGIELLCENNKAEVTRKILAQTQRIGQDVEKVLFYARLGVAEKDYLIREISLRECVMDVLARNKQLLIENGVSVRTERLSHKVRSDSRWVSFILNQLISNSLKYKSARPLVLDFASRDADGYVELSDTDNGLGIRQSELPRIFDKGFVGSNGRGAGVRPVGTATGAGVPTSIGDAIDTDTATGMGGATDTDTAIGIGDAIGLNTATDAGDATKTEAATRPRAATGMGLYLCAQLCERLGIGIRAESEWERSTSICLYFPKEQTTMTQN